MHHIWNYPRMSHHAGMAMMMVLLVLTVLVSLAIPFSFVQRTSYRQGHLTLEYMQARFMAEGAIEYGIARLTQTCDTLERYADQPQLYKTPDYDTAEEYQVQIDIPNWETQNPQGKIWGLQVQDEQGKINLNSVNPWILGNLLGSAQIKQLCQPSDTEIFVDSTQNFASDGGTLWVDGELISYKKTTPDCFVECKRGLYRNSPRFVEPQTLTPGMLVLPSMAYRICRFRIQQEKFFVVYRTVEEIKRIADIGTQTIPISLFERIAPYVTVHSYRDHGLGWIHTQTISENLPNTEDVEKANVIEIANGNMFAPGQTVCIQQDTKTLYAMVLKVRGNRITLDTHIQEKFDKDIAQISILQVHPVHINSASAKVLYSLWKGLTLEGGIHNCIDSREADILANSVWGMRQEGGFFKGTSDVVKFFQNLQAQLRQAQILDSFQQPALSDAEIKMLAISAISGNRMRGRFIGIQNAPSEYIPKISPFAIPLEYRSYDIYTLQGYGSVGGPSGIPSAEKNIQQVIHVSPNCPLRWRMESQKDFATYWQRFSGARMITWPNLISSDVIAEHNPNKPDTGLSLDTVSIAPKGTQGMQVPTYFPWNDTHEGIQVSGENAPTLLPQSGDVDMRPGHISFWYKPAQTKNACTIFSMGNDEWQDFMALRQNRNEISFVMSDATYEEKTAEVSAEVNWQKQWYHIQVAWHTTKPGGLDMWLDGKPVGKFSYTNRHKNRQKAKLVKAIQEKDSQIFLDNVIGLDSSGVVRVGDEIIEYDAIRGNALIVREKYSGYSWNSLRRGARGSVARIHPQGAWVTEFGYSDSIASKIFPASVLSSDVWNVGKLHSKLTAPLVSSSNKILCSTDKFHPRGILLLVSFDPITQKITKEIVKYSSLTGTSFQDCQRGFCKTTAQNFSMEDTYVFPISILLRSTTNYLPEGMVQINREWISYDKKYDDGLLLLSDEFSDDVVKERLENVKSGKAYVEDYRAKWYTLAESHSFGTKALPVFQTQNGYLGYGDSVTLISGSSKPQREANEIAWAYGVFAALRKDVSDTYTPGNHTRILKFPSGEMPIKLQTLSWEKTGTIDELTFAQTHHHLDYSVTHPVNHGDNFFPVNSQVNLIQDAGIWKIGDEFVGFSSITGGQCENVQRGFCGSVCDSHAQGTCTFPVLYVPVTSLLHGVSLYDASWQLQNLVDFPAEGYAMCEDEIISYTNKTGTSIEMPKDEKKQGLLRGSFGTRPNAHPVGSLVYVFPTRYWDRYLADSSHSAYWECAKYAPNAMWKSVVWSEDNPEPNFLQTVVRVRIDGQPKWDSVPTNMAGGLYEFTNPMGTNKIQAVGDTLEMRVYFRYLDKSYERGFWKEKVLLKSMFVEYVQATQILEKE